MRCDRPVLESAPALLESAAALLESATALLESATALSPLEPSRRRVMVSLFSIFSVIAHAVPQPPAGQGLSDDRSGVSVSGVKTSLKQ